MLREVLMWEGGEMLKFFMSFISPPFPGSSRATCLSSCPHPCLFSCPWEGQHISRAQRARQQNLRPSSICSRGWLCSLCPLPEYCRQHFSWLCGCGFLIVALHPLGHKSRNRLPNFPVLRIWFACLPVFSVALGDKQETSDNPNVRRDHLSLREQIFSCRRGGLAAVPLLSWSGPCSLASGADKEAITPSSFTICSKS